MNIDQIKSALFGVAIGDALGVPVEFESREFLKNNPVTEMIGFGSHPVPAGTWSDDSSLTFCLAESITEGLDMHKLSRKFLRWANENYWTPTGYVFDIGISTQESIDRLESGVDPSLSGGTSEKSNGNGSLMRILPLIFYNKNRLIEERYEITKQFSSITHGHIRSVLACFYYLEFAGKLLEGSGPHEAYEALKKELLPFLSSYVKPLEEISHFNRLFVQGIHRLPEAEIESSGYVVHTLEASIWCLLNSMSYEEAVLKAVNLGDDTDTTGAVTGGLAGLVYGYQNIPERWLQQLARFEDIEGLCAALYQKVNT